MKIWTLGRWTAKAGQEDAFVAAWEAFARATKVDAPDTWAVLARDRDIPQVFYSFGPWPSLEAIERWRGSEAFQQGIANVRNHLESFEPHTLDTAVEIR